MAAEESQAGGVYVLHAEPVAVHFENAAGQSFDMRRKSLGANSAAKFTASFDAFGRRFVADLETHDKLNAVVRARGGSAIALRGKLAGVRSSWVRLTQAGEALHGIVWDGEQLIAIAPAQEIAANESSANKTMIFRLSDTVIDPSANTCAASAVGGSDSGASLFDNLKSELSAKSNALPATRQLQLSALMDRSYLGRYATQSQAIDALMVRANNVDGIFTAQLGVDIAVSAIVAEDPTGMTLLPDANKAEDLLSGVSRARAASAELYSAGITHLFTGRDLDGSTVGISYVGAVCSQRYGAALSEARGRDAWYESLIAAHELGHSFGAEHDGEGECATTPATYLMAPVIGHSDRFSQCSLNRIQKQAAQATCLAPLPQPDAAIAAQLGEHRATSASTFTWTMTAVNLGAADATGTRVDIAMPPQLAVQNASVDGAMCSVGAGIVACSIGRLPAQARRTVSMSLSGQFAGSYPVTATVVSDSDANAANNSGQGSIVIEALPLSPAPAPTLAPASNTSEPAITPAPPQSSGGGGAVSFGWLILMLCVARRRAGYRGRKIR